MQTFITDLAVIYHKAPWAFYSIISIFSLMIGSFLNVVIHRLPIMLFQDWRCQCRELLALTEQTEKPTINLIKPASHCPHCEHKITILENIPVLSYLLLAGRCKNCKAPISIRYPLVEILAAICAIIVTYHYGFAIQSLIISIISWMFLVMIFIDIDHQILPDLLTIGCLWLGLFINSFALIVPLTQAVYGAMAGYLSLWSIMMLFKLITGKQGMGHGDFKLFAAIGAIAGINILLVTILMSSLVGAVIGSISLKLSKQSQSTPIPFGPYLAIAGFIAILWGQYLNQLYLTVVGF